ncbi:MAG: PTS transporter subunit EIIC [Erysipelotrichaceae bacterium]|nr:PTS transporter subunit EIIC [Erysipelotrichaceae bacterium]
MKKAWYATREGLQAPLVMYFIAMILLGLGNTFTTESVTLGMLLSALKYCGALIKACFPLFLVINVLGKRHSDSVPVIGGVISYVLLHVVTMFMAEQDLPKVYYNSFDAGGTELTSSIGRMPLNMGLIVSIIVIVLIVYLYRSSRQRFNYGILRFIDNDSWFMILVVVSTLVVGAVVSWIYPHIVRVVDVDFSFVSRNSNNPAAMFIYGLTERIMEIFGMENTIHACFWFGSTGGNWLASNGSTYIGDVNIWTAQLAANAVQPGVGKYITPYYVINMAIVPAILLGIYCQYSSKLERRKMLGLFILAVATSMMSSSMIPLEYLLLIISPALLFISMVLTSTLYGLFISLGIWLGYTYTGPLTYAMPGTLMNFLDISKYMSKGSPITFGIVTVVYFVLSFLLVWTYYRVLAQDFLEPQTKVQTRREMIRALGGIQNISVIDCTPFAMQVALFDNSRIDEDAIMSLGATKIRETYFYYDIEFGPGSVSLCHQIKKEMEAYKDCLKYIETA